MKIPYVLLTVGIESLVISIYVLNLLINTFGPSMVFRKQNYTLHEIPKLLSINSNKSYMNHAVHASLQSTPAALI